MSHPVPDVVRSALVAAEVTCQTRRVQLTPMRRAVLQTLWQAGQPIGAYDIMKSIGAELGRRFSPPTVYRALDFLLAQGLISRIESRNAFVPCANPDHSHACVFFICENCGTSEEIEDRHVERLFEEKADSLGFRINKRVLELQGMCAACLRAASAKTATAL